MEKAYSFLRKLVALCINLLIFRFLREAIPVYISIPVLLLIFSFVTSRILTERPKELFNYKRSESYFAKGGLRDLLRIPQVLFGFIHDVIVWMVWGLYHIFLLVTETVYFFKQVVFWILHGIIWVLKHFVPFWRVAYKMFILYQVKWVWWIYRYAFNSLKKAYNWNMLKVSLIGSFLALFIYQLFYFIDIIAGENAFKFMGLVLALIPITWTFGEISSIRGQNLMYVPFTEVKSKFGNGMESVRGILFFIACFTVIFIAFVFLQFLGFINGAGIVLVGITINISFIFSLFIILIVLLILFSSFTLPTYRLYNKFSELSFNDVYRLFIHIVKRSLQNIIGFIPSAFFAIIAVIPVTLLVGLAFFLTMQVKQATVDYKVDNLRTEQTNAKTQIESYKLSKQIDRLENTIKFPGQFFQDISHKDLLQAELDTYESEKKKLDLAYSDRQTKTNETIKNLEAAIEFERNKQVINQTRLEEYEQNHKVISASYKQFENTILNDIGMLEVDITFTQKQVKQTNILFYLSGLLTVVVFTLILTFALSFFGNFFYRAFLFRNDGTPSEWKGFIQSEKEINKNQPLLSTTLNIIALLIIVGLILNWFDLNLFKILSFVFRSNIHG